MKIQEALRLARSMMDAHGLTTWSVKADRSRTYAGRCFYTRQTIQLSSLWTEAQTDDAHVIDTILHEIAHALVGHAAGHDATWRRQAVELGCTGMRCISADAIVPVGVWTGVCACGASHERQRAPLAGRTYFCKRCRDDILWVS